MRAYHSLLVAGLLLLSLAPALAETATPPASGPTPGVTIINRADAKDPYAPSTSAAGDDQKPGTVAKPSGPRTVKAVPRQPAPAAPTTAEAPITPPAPVVAGSAPSEPPPPVPDARPRRGERLGLPMPNRELASVPQSSEPSSDVSRKSLDELPGWSGRRDDPTRSPAEAEPDDGGRAAPSQERGDWRAQRPAPRDRYAGQPDERWQRALRDERDDARSYGQRCRRLGRACDNGIDWACRRYDRVCY